MLPTLLIAVGVADSVHIIAEFRAYHAECGDRREAARRTMYLVGTPCLLTSLTTAAGFASLSIAPIKSLAHFAIYSAVGVVAAFLLSVTLLLFFLSFGRQKLPREATELEKIQAKGGSFFQAVLLALADFVIQHRKAILVVWGGIFALSVVGITRVRVDSNFLHEFSPEEPLRIATEYVDEKMGGTYSIVYLFDSGAPEGIKEPDFLHEVERLQVEANGHADIVKKTYSIADLLKDINRSFNEENALHYRLPESRDLAAQYLLVYEMSGGEELSDYVSSDFARASLELRVKAVETSELGRLTAALDDFLDRNPVEASRVSTTGVGALWLALMEYVTRSQIRGFLLAFSVIAVLLCLVFRSLKTGLMVMVPNLSPVLLTLGAMGWLDIPLDYIRLLIASVAIGISVDDTVHHVTRFRFEFRRSGSYEQALRASMTDVGRALVITSVVLVLGFLVFLLSRLDTMVIFGSLLATTIGVALVADFLLMPALVLTLRPWGAGRASPSGLEVSRQAASP
jgi:predicted RND superfamily exporter protein